MSGFAGHMMHPHDDLEMTREDLIGLIRSSLNGSLRFSEKIDGWGLCLLYISDKWYITRSKKDMELGGIPKEDIPERFKHNPKAVEVYTEALEIIESHDRDDWKDFGETGIYYVADVTKGRLNVIDYGSTTKLWIHCAIDKETGRTVPTPIISTTDLQVGGVNGYLMGNTGSNVSGGFEQTIESIMNPGETIGHYYQRRFIELLDQKYPVIFDMDKEAVVALWEAIFEGKGRLKILRKYLDEKMIDYLLGNKDDIYRYLREPLDNIILQVGTLINMDYFTASPSDSMIYFTLITNYNTYQYRRWRDNCMNHIPGNEGVVCQYKGKTYKWTGAFAPINQLWGQRK